MVVLGIDPGTATTGFGLVRETADRLSALDYGVITTPADLDMPSRLKLLFRELGDLLLRHRPESAAVEKLFFQRNVATAMTVGQARGVALLALAEAGVSVAEYAPNEVKQAVVGYGGAGKRQVQSMIQVVLNLPGLPRPDDAADALAVAICHLHSARLKQLIEE